MTTNQINRKEMHDTVINYLDTNVSKWGSISKLSEFINSFTEINMNIETAASKQEGSKVAVGKSKHNLKKTLAEKGDIVNDMLETYAVIIGNTELKAA